MKKTKKPNILIFMTDQHRYEALGCHGNKILKTPNIDKLAAGGGLIFSSVTASLPYVCLRELHFLLGSTCTPTA